MSKHRSIHRRVFFLLLTQALVALIAVAVVAAASEEPAQPPAPSARTTGDAWLFPGTFPEADLASLAPRQPNVDTTLSVSIVSSPWAINDSNKPQTEGPRVMVVEAAITNIGSTTAILPVITLDYNEDPANGWGLLPGEAPVRKLEELGPGETYHAYWFATYALTYGTGHVYTVSASADNASLVSTSQNVYRPTADTVETVRSLGGGSTRLQESTSAIYVGVAFTATVRWNLGTNFQSVLLSPVGNVDFDPSSYRLVASKVTFLAGSTPISSVADRLYFPTVPAGTTHALAEFVFLALRATETRICPYTTPRYPQDFKYDNGYCTPGLPIRGTVTLSMTKQVNASEVQQGQMLTYTIAFTNNGTKPLGNVWIWDDVDPAIGSIIIPTIDPPGDPTETTEQRAAWNVRDITASGEPGSTGMFTFTILVDGGGQDLADQTPIVNDVFFGIDPVEVPADAALTSTVTTMVQAPTIVVAKTDGLDIVKTGEALTYTLRITNSGSVAASSVVVTDLLPSGVIPGGGSSSTWHPAPIPPHGGFQVITIPLTVDAIVPDASILTNIMTATYQNDAGWVYDPKTDTDDTTVSAPFWVLIKSDDPDPVQAGATLTYTLSYFHNGITPGQDVTIVDTLPAEVTYNGIVSQPSGWGAPVYDAGPPATLTWYTPSLTVGASGTMVFSVTVDSGASGLITNDATLTSTDPVTDTMTSEETTVETSTDLAVTKTDDPDPVFAGNTLTYTLQVSNDGPSDASGVTLTDTLPAGVTLASADPSQGSFDDTTGVWSVGNLASGDSASLTLVLTVDSSTTGALFNRAVVSGDQDDPDTANNTDTEWTTVETSTDLAVTKSDDPDPVFAGNTLTYTLQVSNTGPSDASGVTLTDTLPTGVTFVSADPDQGSFDDTTGVWSIGNLASGDSASLTLVLTVDSSTTGILSNEAIVSGDQDDPNSTNDSATERTTVETSADLAVTKADDPDPVFAGNTLTYTLQVSNTGPSDATGVTLTDTLPTGVTFVSADPSQGSFDDTTGAWSVGALASGDSASLTLVVTVDSSTTGILSNRAIISGDQDDPNTANNTDTEQTTVETSADLAITKSDDPDPVAAAGTLVYTLTYTNSGPSDALHVYITDTLDANTMFGGVVSQPAGWTALPPDPGEPNVRIWYADSLAEGASDSIVFTVTVNADTIGEVVNRVTISSDTPDDDTTNNSDLERTAVGDPSRATIYGYVFVDTNCNGIWDGDETPISDVPISLDGPTSDNTWTNDLDPVGLYYFITDQAGVYRVIETDLDGYFSTTPNEVHLAVALGHSYRVDFGDAQGSECAAIYGTVFEDANSNAKWDAIELGISDVTITLDAAATTTTNEYGSYTFPTTVAGLHTVVETDPVGYMSTTPNEVDVDVLLGNGYQVDFGDVQFCTCPADEYEEDDTWQLAKELTVGVTQTHSFCDDATDWTSFTVQRGFVYTITTSSWGQRADTVLSLYGPDGQTLLASSDDFEGTDDYSSLIIWQAPTSAQGSYYVRTTNRAGLIGCDTEYDLGIAQKGFYFYYLPLIPRQYSGATTAGQTEAPAQVEQAPVSVETVQDLAQPEGAAAPEIALSPTGIITHTCPDLYEVDDTWELAKPIGDGELQVHSFDSDPREWAADKDFVWFYLQNGGSITFTLPSVTGTQTLMELYDSNGIPIPEHATTADQLVLTDLAQGRYFLSVSPRLASYGCANVAGYELKADMSRLTVIYLPLVLRSW